jgi:hypothetical protein
MGAVTGTVDEQTRPAGGFDLGSIRIADAVQLRTVAKPGQILVDKRTFDSLSQRMRKSYDSDFEEVRNNQGVLYLAWRCTMNEACGSTAGLLEPVSPAQGPARNKKPRPEVSTSTGRDDLKLVQLMTERLAQPTYLLDHLMIAIEMPEEARPPDTLEHGKRCTKVFAWAKAGGKAGTENLRSSIQHVLDKNRSSAREEEGS